MGIVIVMLKISSKNVLITCIIDQLTKRMLYPIIGIAVSSTIVTGAKGYFRKIQFKGIKLMDPRFESNRGRLL